jgi:hypothetical protein
MMTKLRFCLQCKTKWFDGDSWWHTESTSESIEHLQNDSLPILKQHNKEEQAKSGDAIDGYEYRIVLEIVMLGDL